MHVERLKTKEEWQGDKKDSSLWLFILLFIIFNAIGLPIIIFWLT